MTEKSVQTEEAADLNIKELGNEIVQVETQEAFT